MNEAARSFVDYFGELGPRWGLDSVACRVHALLYLSERRLSPPEVAAALSLEESEAADALEYLAEWRVADPDKHGSWSTGSEPWDMLFAGLEERRRREIGPALTRMKQCHDQAMQEGADRQVIQRIGAVKALVEDLSALDAQARRLPPRILRAITALGGSASRLANRFRGDG